MSIVELSSVPESETIEADICIIGSGPAGATLAIELAATKLRVVMVESGGLERDAEADSLNEIESVGWPRVEDQWIVRNRILGGSSHTWRGKCAPFDDIDYEVRDWVPHSGWPLRPSDLTHYLERSSSHMGLGAGSGYTGLDFWKIANRKSETPTFNQRLLVPYFWQFTKDKYSPFDYMRFGKRLTRGDAGNATIFLHATVVHINADDVGASVQSAEVRGRDGRLRTIKAPLIVLCAGGIENARLLLSSNRQFPSGLGNQNDLVGRFLMDHPRGAVGTFNPETSDEALDWFGLYNVKTKYGSHRYRHGLQLSPEYQRTHKLLNCAVFLEERLTDDDPWSATIRLLRHQGTLPRDAINIVSNVDAMAKGIYQYYVKKKGLTRKYERIELLGIVEQLPDPNSRITLSDRKDVCGTPLAKIDWKVSGLEQETMRVTARLVTSEFARLGQEPPELENWVMEGKGFPTNIRDVAHPTGTTRMSNIASQGVVDVNCEVHGVRGLFVMGSSLFPTASHANPTQMIAALAIRLADLLKKRTKGQA
jgi:choline dehydrogenase-like flavoprotein